MSLSAAGLGLERITGSCEASRARAERDAFYGSPLFKDSVTQIEPMVEGKSEPAAIERTRGLVSRCRGAHAAALENGPLDLARGMARRARSCGRSSRRRSDRTFLKSSRRDLSRLAWS